MSVYVILSKNKNRIWYHHEILVFLCLYLSKPIYKLRLFFIANIQYNHIFNDDAYVYKMGRNECEKGYSIDC